MPPALRVKDGILTLYDALFQETCTRFLATEERFSRLQLGPASMTVRF
jgi:hypothetical protein